MNNANTAEGLGYLFAVFEMFPVLKVLLAVFIAYLLVRSVFTFRSAKPVLSGRHYIEGTLVFHSEGTDAKGRKLVSTNIKVGSEFYEFATREKMYSRLPNYSEGDPARIYFAPSAPGLKFLWVPSSAELMKTIFSSYIQRPIGVFILAVIVFWLFPLMFIL